MSTFLEAEIILLLHFGASLSESIRYTEKIQIDRLKREKLPLPPDYREPTTDLAC